MKLSCGKKDLNFEDVIRKPYHFFEILHNADPSCAISRDSDDHFLLAATADSVASCYRSLCSLVRGVQSTSCLASTSMRRQCDIVTYGFSALLHLNQLHGYIFLATAKYQRYKMLFSHVLFYIQKTIVKCYLLDLYFLKALLLYRSLLALQRS